jgi:alcohol dehydrogenase
MGAEKIIAAGRDGAALASVVAAAGSRASAVVMTGDLAADVAALRDATVGGAHLALDLVGRAKDTLATQATLKALRRGGRMVLMGSATEPVPLNYSEMLGNDWEIMGQFMYRPEGMRTLAALVRGGLLDLGGVVVKTFPLEELPAAIVAAAGMRGLECTVMVV